MIKTIRVRNFKGFPGDRHVVIDLSRDNRPITVSYGLNGAGSSPLPCRLEALPRSWASSSRLSLRRATFSSVFISNSFYFVDNVC